MGHNENDNSTPKNPNFWHGEPNQPYTPNQEQIRKEQEGAPLSNNPQGSTYTEPLTIPATPRFIREHPDNKSWFPDNPTGNKPESQVPYHPETIHVPTLEEIDFSQLSPEDITPEMYTEIRRRLL